MPKVFDFENPCLDSILHSYFTPKKDTKIFLKRVKTITAKDGSITKEGLTGEGYKAMQKLHRLLIAIQKVSGEDFSPDEIIDSLYDVAATDC